MILKDVLEKAKGIICDDEINLEEDSKKRKKLIDCASLIYRELTEQYIELKTKEKLYVENDKIYYSAFSKKVKDIINISKDGQKVGFKLLPTYLECVEKGEVEIKYVYNTDELELTDEIILPPPYTDNMLSMGIASEYFFRSGLIDEALFYKNRYDNALINMSRRRNGFILKERSFL